MTDAIDLGLTPTQHDTLTGQIEQWTAEVQRRIDHHRQLQEATRAALGQLNAAEGYLQALQALATAGPVSAPENGAIISPPPDTPKRPGV
jgi:hypothetical protein